MSTQILNKLSESLANTEKMPTLFLGHGNPMNAIEDNVFVEGFRNVEKQIQRPKYILCISAHWETKGTFVTAMENPRTIHDFWGFPQELFDVQYPAPGSPELAKEVKNSIKETELKLDYNWGLDHGAWSVLKHLYPQADIPIIQLSLDSTKPPSYHFELVRELSILRSKGVLIVGSGNLVHNLRLATRISQSEKPFAFDWAIEANEKIKSFVLDGDVQSLINYNKQGKAFELAIPTPEHFLPLLYALALKDEKDQTKIFNDLPLAGSLTMTSMKFG